MQYGYLIMREDIEDSDESKWGYPQYIYHYPVEFHEHKSNADMRILELYQEGADEFMDWLDIEKEYVKKGYYDHIDISLCPLEQHDYICYKVPYYKSVSLEHMIFERIDAKNVINIGYEEKRDSIIAHKPIKIID